MNDDLINREDKFRAFTKDNTAIVTDRIRLLSEITEHICRLIDEYKKQGYTYEEIKAIFTAPDEEDDDL